MMREKKKDFYSSKIFNNHRRTIVSKEEKKKQELCAFISLLQAMGIDVIAISGDSLKKRKGGK